MAEIFAGDNPTKDGCTIADIDALCKIHARNYTVQDAEAYCMLEGAAHREFWKSHYRKHHPKHYATTYRANTYKGKIISASDRSISYQKRRTNASSSRNIDIRNCTAPLKKREKPITMP